MNEINGECACGARVLVIEDEMLVAMMVEDVLAEAGYRVLGPVATVENALSILETGSKIDIAVMDLNLSGQTSLPLANVFRERNIPFMIMTGYGSAPLSPPHELVRVLSKPFDPADLIAMLQETLDLATLPPR
jgi:CheY-like chemotaxis protein